MQWHCTSLQERALRGPQEKPCALSAGRKPSTNEQQRRKPGQRKTCSCMEPCRRHTTSFPQVLARSSVRASRSGVEVVHPCQLHMRLLLAHCRRSCRQRTGQCCCDCADNCDDCKRRKQRKRRVHLPVLRGNGQDQPEDERANHRGPLRQRSHGPLDESLLFGRNGHALQSRDERDGQDNRAHQQRRQHTKLPLLLASSCRQRDQG
mmetsp:Transcript_14618/g.33117  ORF Transcript_14618/g.33117 Transcript_14618/m.33117 type:complete len:206 (-) Transcript_14618:138-755(-)